MCQIVLARKNNGKIEEKWGSAHFVTWNIVIMVLGHRRRSG
jgi:hypothetical protein